MSSITKFLTISHINMLLRFRATNNFNIDYH